MNVSIENVISESQQTQNDNQEIIAENNESTEPSSIENNQNTSFNLEKSKNILEYISIILALIGLISTGLIKVLSMGRYLCFDFDINNCEFKLTNSDFIILFLSIFFCGSAILYCFITNKLRVIISTKVTECLDTQTKILKKIAGIVKWGLLYIALIFFYLILGYFAIGLFTSNFSALAILENELVTILGYTFTFVILLSCFILKEDRKFKIFYITISMLFLLLFGLSFIKNSYDEAVNQKEFEIITLKDSEENQMYAVISRGSSYSAYQCLIDENNILIINTELHRFFSLDDTETRLYNFEGYRLVKYK